MPYATKEEVARLRLTQKLLSNMEQEMRNDVANGKYGSSGLYLRTIEANLSLQVIVSTLSREVENDPSTHQGNP